MQSVKATDLGEEVGYDIGIDPAVKCYVSSGRFWKRKKKERKK